MLNLSFIGDEFLRLMERQRIAGWGQGIFSKPSFGNLSFQNLKERDEGLFDAKFLSIFLEENLHYS